MPRRPAGIRDFVLDNVEAHPKDIVRLAAETFGVTRQGVLWHVHQLEKEGLLSTEGKTKGRMYRLRDFFGKRTDLDLGHSLEEHRVWLDNYSSELRDLPENVYRILLYGFTEILNNAIDHSAGTTATTRVLRNARRIQIEVLDDGIGIFRKIRQEKDLIDERQALFELQKGKLTTDEAKHTGEGIFFTSRAFDHFEILSRCLFFSHDHSKGDEGDWLLGTEDKGEDIGTAVSMAIASDSDRDLADVFEKYTSEDAGAPGFSMTHVPLTLATQDGEILVSRSQAKRVLARVTNFREVLLDFTGVDSIGQAFADEVFRVFARQNPGTRLRWTGASPAVERMILRAVVPEDEKDKPK